jgi:hypothetical protein
MLIPQINFPIISLRLSYCGDWGLQWALKYQAFQISLQKVLGSCLTFLFIQFLLILKRCSKFPTVHSLIHLFIHLFICSFIDDQVKRAGNRLVNFRNWFQNFGEKFTTDEWLNFVCPSIRNNHVLVIHSNLWGFQFVLKLRGDKIIIQLVSEYLWESHKFVAKVDRCDVCLHVPECQHEKVGYASKDPCRVCKPSSVN